MTTAEDRPDQREGPYIPCPECGAPTESNQRYCVNCGAHCMSANDPAAEYLRQATAARARVAAAAARGTRRRRRLPNLAVAVLVALVPAAAGVGIAIGDSSAGHNAHAQQTAGSKSGSGASNKSSGYDSNATGSNYTKQEGNASSGVSEP